LVGGAARAEPEAGDVPLSHLRLPPARDEPARADRARRRRVTPPARARRVRRRREAHDLRRVAQDAAAPQRLEASAAEPPTPGRETGPLRRPLGPARTRGYTVPSQAPVAQGIERCPAEAEVACSNHAGRTCGCSGALAPGRLRCPAASTSR